MRKEREESAKRHPFLIGGEERKEVTFEGAGYIILDSLWGEGKKGGVARKGKGGRKMKKGLALAIS